MAGEHRVERATWFQLSTQARGRTTRASAEKTRLSGKRIRKENKDRGRRTFLQSKSSENPGTELTREVSEAENRTDLAR